MSSLEDIFCTFVVSIEKEYIFTHYDTMVTMSKHSDGYDKAQRVLIYGLTDSEKTFWFCTLANGALTAYNFFLK